MYNRVCELSLLVSLLATSNLWLETVLLIIPLLPKEVVKRQILRIAEANGQLSMSVGSRQGTCKLLGAMASKFDSYWCVDAAACRLELLVQYIDRPLVVSCI